MKPLDIKLYKISIIKGKEEIAEEWMQFLKENTQEGIKTLKNEKVYLESYFKAMENDTMYLYLFLAAENIERANAIAGESENELDKKHFEYMKACVELTSSTVLDAVCYMNNLEDYRK